MGRVSAEPQVVLDEGSLPLVSSAQMRTLDQRTIELGTPGHVLMERAGAGACEMLCSVFPHILAPRARVVVIAGKGNNGGDGLVIARLLQRRGVRTVVALLASAADLRGDALRNLRAYRRSRGAVHEIADSGALAKLLPEMQRAACVVDALLGTGLRSEVTGLYADAIEMINSCGAPVLAVDIPSGLDPDTGAAEGAVVQADATATFGFAKLGQVQHPGIGHCGALAVVDIGIDGEALLENPPRAALLRGESVTDLVPRRSPVAHKGSAGHLAVIAGALGKAGAAILATRAGLRGGAGLVTMAGPHSVNAVCASAVPEAMTEPWPDRKGELIFEADRVSALVETRSAVTAGPGLGTGPGVRATVGWLLRYCHKPLVLDADALNVVAGRLAPLRRAVAPVVLTPHPGEMSRLAGVSTAEVQADRVGIARAFASDHRCVVVLKGAGTVVAAPDGQIWINSSGNPGMASGGMGDVLAGLIGALLAQGLAAEEAARLGVYLHGYAADLAAARGTIGLIASDVIDFLPEAMRRIDEQLTD